MRKLPITRIVGNDNAPFKRLFTRSNQTILTVTRKVRLISAPRATRSRLLLIASSLLASGAYIAKVAAIVSAYFPKSNSLSVFLKPPFILGKRLIIHFEIYGINVSFRPFFTTHLAT